MVKRVGLCCHRVAIAARLRARILNTIVLYSRTMPIFCEHMPCSQSLEPPVPGLYPHTSSHHHFYWVSGQASMPEIDSYIAFGVRCLIRQPRAVAQALAQSGLEGACLSRWYSDDRQDGGPGAGVPGPVGRGRGRGTLLSRCQSLQRFCSPPVFRVTKKGPLQCLLVS